MHTDYIPPLLNIEQKSIEQLKTHLNKLFRKLCYLREMDFEGKIRCSVCKQKKPYTHVEMKNYYKASCKYPLRFVFENVYFCCETCRFENIEQTKVYRLFQQYPNMCYNRENVIEVINLLERKLKNHTKI